MRIMEITMVVELTPDEREENAIDLIIENRLEDLQRGGTKWEMVKKTKKERMQFDVNYNAYYAKVKFERAS
jgi:hypothetical protein